MIRRHGSRPTIALWMLVAIADFALVVAATGALVMLVVAGAMVLAGAAAAVMMQRRAVAGVTPVQARAVTKPESMLRRRA